MTAILVIIHVLVCLALILIVLLQAGKGADIGAAFGGGSSQTLFGSSGATGFLGKATTIAAVIFMATSLALAFLATNKRRPSVMEAAPVPIEQTAAGQTQAPPPELPADQGAALPAPPAPGEKE